MKTMHQLGIMPLVQCRHGHYVMKQHYPWPLMSAGGRELVEGLKKRLPFIM